ncbi:MAG TPA: MmgE/PrpD family protein, partial [Acidovorax sp.]
MGRAMGDAPDWNLATATLGQDFHITRMTFKNHACCGHTFAPIDGALELQARMGVRWQALDAMEVATYAPALAVAGNFTPSTAAEARFSIPFVVATALIHGSVRLSAFTPERLADADIRALMARIRLSVDPELDTRFPGQRAARLRLTTTDGRQAEYLQPTRKGDPEQPLTDAELSDKFMELAAPVVGDGRARTLLGNLWALDTRTHLLDL